MFKHSFIIFSQTLAQLVKFLEKLFFKYFLMKKYLQHTRNMDSIITLSLRMQKESEKDDFEPGGYQLAPIVIFYPEYVWL